MATHARLYATESGWNAANTQIMEAIGSSEGGSWTYDSIKQVDNPDHDDFEKYVLRIETSGIFKCDQVFSSGNVPLDSTWFSYNILTGEPPE